jgi:hypothetical protein
MATTRNRRATLENSTFPGAPQVLFPGGDSTIERGSGSAFLKASAATQAKFAAADALITAGDALDFARSSHASPAQIAAALAALNAADAAATSLGI